MTSYTNAPACKMLATHCCVCNRPLVDALSVELGIGPDCRKKYMGKLEGPARDRANKLVHALALLISGMLPEDVEGVPADTVKAAYALGGTKAVGAMLAATSERGSSMLDELRTLGFDKLADKFEDAWLPVRITEVGQEIMVEAPYNDAAVDAQRKIKGRRWDKAAKANFFPISQKPAVWAMLVAFYAGFAGIGPKGAFVVGPTGITNPAATRREERKSWLQNAVAIAALADERHMQEIEAEADRAGTLRDETNKAYARGMM